MMPISGPVMGKGQGKSHFAVHNSALHFSGSECLLSARSTELSGRLRFQLC